MQGRKRVSEKRVLRELIGTKTEVERILRTKKLQDIDKSSERNMRASEVVGYVEIMEPVKNA
jgi:hypothetical protein